MGGSARRRVVVAAGRRSRRSRSRPGRTAWRTSQQSASSSSYAAGAAAFAVGAELRLPERGSSSARSRSPRRSRCGASGQQAGDEGCSTGRAMCRVSGAGCASRVDGEHEPAGRAPRLCAPERDHRRAAWASLPGVQRNVTRIAPIPSCHVPVRDGRPGRRPLHHVLGDADDQPSPGPRGSRRERAQQDSATMVRQGGRVALSRGRFWRGRRPALNGPNGLFAGRQVDRAPGLELVRVVRVAA